MDCIAFSISQSAVGSFRYIHGVLLSGVLGLGTLWVIWSSVVDALNTPGEVPADHIKNIQQYNKVLGSRFPLPPFAPRLWNPL